MAPRPAAAPVRSARPSSPLSLMGPGHGYWVPWQAIQRVPWVGDIVEVRFTLVLVLSPSGDGGRGDRPVPERGCPGVAGRGRPGQCRDRRRSRWRFSSPPWWPFWPNLPLTTRAVGSCPGGTPKSEPNFLRARCSFLTRRRSRVCSRHRRGRRSTTCDMRRPGEAAPRARPTGRACPTRVRGALRRRVRCPREPSRSHLGRTWPRSGRRSLPGGSPPSWSPVQEELPVYERGRSTSYAVGLLTAAMGRPPTYGHSAWVCRRWGQPPRT